MKIIKLSPILFLIFVTYSVGAYELATHALVTHKAFLKSKLNSNGTLVKDLGIDGLLLNPVTSIAPFGKTYYDVQNGTVQPRTGRYI